MNLKEAILEGAKRVDRRGIGEYVYVNALDDEVKACLIGAAYLGCHPDVDPRELDRQREPFNEWVRTVAMPPEVGERWWWGKITGINDFNPPPSGGDDWEQVVGILGETHPGLLDIEVCDQEVSA